MQEDIKIPQFETQLEQVERHLRSGKEITTWQAIQEYGITRLPRYIHTLKKSGLKIKDKWLERDGKRFKKWTISE